LQRLEGHARETLGRVVPTTRHEQLQGICRQFAVENDLIGVGYNTEQGVVALLSKELMSRPSVDAETKRAIVEALHMERG